MNWETDISKTSREKTQEMRLQHIFFELDTFIKSERADAQLRGPRVKPYLEFFLKSLEKKLLEIRTELEKINYQEID